MLPFFRSIILLQLRFLSLFSFFLSTFFPPFYSPYIYFALSVYINSIFVIYSPVEIVFLFLFLVRFYCFRFLRVFGWVCFICAFREISKYIRTRFRDQNTVYKHSFMFLHSLTYLINHLIPSQDGWWAANEKHLHPLPHCLLWSISAKENCSVSTLCFFYICFVSFSGGKMLTNFALLLQTMLVISRNVTI